MSRASEAAPRAEAASEADAPPRRRRRWPWIVLLLLVAFVVGVRVALPTAVERGVAWGSRHYLGLPARLDNADFDFWNGRVVLEGITVGARPDGVAPNDAALEPPVLDPAAALLHVQRVATQLSWRDLRDRTVRLTEFVIVSPTARLEREADGRVDPLRHAQPVAVPSSEPEPPEEPGEPSPPWKIALDRFDLRAPALRVIDVPTGENLVELSLDDFRLDGVAVLGNQLELAGVGIEGPVLRVRRDLLLAERSAPPAAPPPATAAVPAPTPAGEAAPAPAGAPAAPPQKPGYRVTKIDVERATFTWITESGPLDVAITLQAANVTADEGERFPVSLQLEIGDGRIAVAGDVGILPPAYTGSFSWSDLPIPRLLLASVPQFADWLQQAKSTGDLAIDADPSGAKGEPSMRVSGRLSFDALAVADPKGTEITLGWKQLEVVIDDVYAPLPVEGKPPGTTKAKLASVKLVEPKIRYTRPSPQLDALLGINLSGGAGAGGAKPAEEAAEAPAPEEPVAEKVEKSAAPDGAPAEGPIDLAIASLEMTDGEVEAIDKTVQPVARTRVRGLSLHAQQVRFPEPAADDVRFHALLPTSAQLDVQGELAAGNVGDFTLKLRQLDLPVFNPYADLAGVTVDSGTASADVKLKMRGAKMEIDNRLVLNELGVSMRKPETFEREFGVPIDLALALLRDPKGNIELRVPVKVDEQGSSVDVGAIVRSALKAAIVGAVTAPLKMIGAVFGGGGDDGGVSLDPLPAVAGGAQLEGDQSARIDGLAAMLAQRPAIGLALRGRTGPADRPKLAEQMLLERWQAGEGLPELEDAGFFERRRIGQALSARVAGEDAPLEGEDQALYERYVAAVQVPDERLAALATQRAEHVRERLVAKGVPAQRVAVAGVASEGEPGVVVGFAAGS
ncbi:MAG: hypothetical protein DCC71_06945 [Proteobacteria bacterium]|nr:MAG: hypothetical protein DCC71_06945 [Pseudomonadota bacterium]